MKSLEDYLGEYLQHEITDKRQGVFDANNLPTWIKEGIEAYKSTENVSIDICGGDCPECGESMTLGDATLFDGDGCEVVVCKYECAHSNLGCGYLIYC